jgi:predicted helicase
LTFVELSTAQKTKAYDMYARFFSWAFNRLKDDGIVAFVTNRSFVDSRTFDGFRRYVGENFAEAWVVDLGGDVRANPKISGTKHNVFGIQTGVAISFLVKRKGAKQCVIRYVRRPEFDTKDDKLAWLGSSRLSSLPMERVEPDRAANWINLSENDWDSLIPVADKKTKAAKVTGQERAVFKLFSLGVSTNRDEWLYARDPTEVERKSTYLLGRLEDTRRQELPFDIKLSRNLKRRLEDRWSESFALERVGRAAYRPFDKRLLFRSPLLIDEPGSLFEFFLEGNRNPTICFNHVGSRANACFLATDASPDLHFGAAIDAYQYASRYRYTPSGERLDNITDWGLKTFTDHYGKTAGVTRDAIFAYVYAALHDPIWRETYAINLKRDFPRIPLHPHFGLWAGWGQRLLDLHIGYEGVDPWPVTRRDIPDEKSRKAGVSPRVILKSDRSTGTVTLDSETVISGIPAVAWDYRLGNRTAIDWVLDHLKEMTPKDPTIRAKFNTYRFADHKEKVADLIARVARVSVETVGIVEEIRAARRG